jgi:hypothetical protein
MQEQENRPTPTPRAPQGGALPPRITIEEFTEAVFSGVMRAMDARNERLGKPGSDLDLTFFFGIWPIRMPFEHGQQEPGQ